MKKKKTDQTNQKVIEAECHFSLNLPKLFFVKSPTYVCVLNNILPPPAPRMMSTALYEKIRPFAL